MSQESAIGTDLFVAFVATLIITVIYAALKLRRILRQFGELMASQAERPDPDPGDPHEDTKANRDEDPR